MRLWPAVRALLAAAILCCGSGAAHALRPFDGTDAAVADPGEVEIELGPAEYLRDGAERVLFAPDLRVNYGLAPNWEASIEGDLAHALAGDLPPTSLVGGIASLKTILRDGTLRDRSGPSLATEFDVLLPGTPEEHGTGVGLTGILSQHWPWATLHLNIAAALTREQHADYFFDAIVEGPHDWPVRPVGEFFYERDVGAFATRSGLVGAIWQAQENLAFDVAVRGARSSGATAGEIRAGVTFAFGATKAANR